MSFILANANNLMNEFNETAVSHYDMNSRTHRCCCWGGGGGGGGGVKWSDIEHSRRRRRSTT